MARLVVVSNRVAVPVGKSGGHFGAGLGVVELAVPGCLVEVRATARRKAASARPKPAPRAAKKASAKKSARKRGARRKRA